MVYAFFRALCRLILRLTGRPQVGGAENIPAGGAFVLAANHQSILDPLVLMALLPRPITFLAASYLFKIPLVGPVVRAAGALPVKGTGSMGSVKAGLSRLLTGGVVGIFPEGGVSFDGRLKPFHAGWAYLALKAGVPVLPVAIAGSREVLPAGKYMPRRGRIRVLIGAPLPVKKRPRIRRADLEELNRRLAAAIGRLLSRAAGSKGAENPGPGGS